MTLAVQDLGAAAGDPHQQLIDAVRAGGPGALAEELDSALQALRGLRSDATARKVVPHLVAHPVVNAAFLQRHLDLSGVAVQRAVAQLADAGVLTERTGKRRGRVWEHSGIIDVLDDYARSLRRR